MVIAKTVMSTDHKTQKESYTRSAYCFSLSKCQLRSSFTRLLHLHETRNVHENLSLSLSLSVCVCVRALVRACVRAYVCKGCCNMNLERGRSGREIMASRDGKIV